MSCPLCGKDRVRDYHKDKRRCYLQCLNCFLVFVPQVQRLGKTEEKAIYDLHENNPNDAGYQRFLGRLADPLLARIPASSTGLDFGCGPGPVLAAIFSKAGHRVSLFDAFYAPDTSVFDNRYDFISATEVVEHLFFPGRELERLWQCLKPGGWLGLMTKLVIDQDAFANWHYKNDPTHVCFFSRDTFRWWADKYSASPEWIGNDVILIQKPLFEHAASD